MSADRRKEIAERLANELFIEPQDLQINPINSALGEYAASVLEEAAKHLLTLVDDNEEHSYNRAISDAMAAIRGGVK